MKDKREFMYPDAEIQKMDQDENLKKAIGLLMALDRSFSNNMAEYQEYDQHYKSIINKLDLDAPDLTERLTNDLKEYRQSKSKALGRKFPQKLDNKYYSAETLFKKQCEEKRKSDPTFDIEVFAECEKKRIEGIIEQVEQLTYKSYYAKHPTYAQGKEYIKYLSKVSNGLIEKKAPIYVLKNESVILKLFEDYGEPYFPEEEKEDWKKRWTTGDDTLLPIRTDNFRNGNNKHLLLTILHEAFDLLRVANRDDYIKRRWGLRSYHSDVSKYLGFDKVNKCYKDLHPESKRIKEILKPELF